VWLKKKGVKARIGEDVILRIVSLAEEKREGARPVRRLIKRFLEEPLAYELLSLDEEEQRPEFVFTVREDEISLERRSERLGRRYHLVFDEGG